MEECNDNLRGSTLFWRQSADQYCKAKQSQRPSSSRAQTLLRSVYQTNRHAGTQRKQFSDLFRHEVLTAVRKRPIWSQQTLPPSTVIRRSALSTLFFGLEHLHRYTLSRSGECLGPPRQLGAPQPLHHTDPTINPRPRRGTNQETGTPTANQEGIFGQNLSIH